MVNRGNSAHLQNIVILHTLSDGNFFRYRQRIRQVLVREFVHLNSVICNDDDNGARFKTAMSCQNNKKHNKTRHLGMIRAWPLASGLMSRNE